MQLRRPAITDCAPTHPRRRANAFLLHNEKEHDCTDIPWFGRDFPRRLRYFDGNDNDHHSHPRAKLDVRAVTPNLIALRRSGARPCAVVAQKPRSAENRRRQIK